MRRPDSWSTRECDAVRAAVRRSQAQVGRRPPFRLPTESPTTRRLGACRCRRRYRRAGVPWTVITELVWVDRSGTRQGVAAPAGTYLSFSIAPDGRRVAAARLDPRIGTADIWMFGPGEHEIRVTDNPDWDMSPVWSPDGQCIVYASRRQNRWRLYRRNPTAIAPEELLLDSDTPVTPLQTVSANDVLYAAQRPRSTFDLWQLADGGVRRRCCKLEECTLRMRASLPTVIG